MDSARPIRLLHVAPRFYGRPITGAEQRNYHLGARLAKHMRVVHVGFSRPEESPFPEADNPRHRFISVPRPASYRPLDLLRGAVGPLPFSVLNYTRGEMEDVLARLLREERFDIVQLEGVQLAGYLPLLRRAVNRPRAIVCDWHNIESEVLHRYADAAANPALRLYARHAANRLEEFERRFVHQCDMHVVVSERDRDTLARYGAGAPIVLIDNGVDVESFSDCAGARGRPPAGRFRVVFVGAMDYHANVDAVKNFALSAWPEVHRRLPQSVFTIVGRNPGSEIRSLGTAPGIEVTGTVPDVRPYYAEAFAAVAPLRVAGGTRLKILEAMAAGVPVVATTRGAEGLAVDPNVHFLLANTAGEMCEAVVLLSRDSVKAAHLVSAGLELVRRRYDWAALGDALAGRLLALVESLRATGNPGFPAIQERGFS
jgi:polysaccharide biosynthesis protein PslH